MGCWCLMRMRLVPTGPDDAFRCCCPQNRSRSLDRQLRRRRRGPQQHLLLLLLQGKESNEEETVQAAPQMQEATVGRLRQQQADASSSNNSKIPHQVLRLVPVSREMKELRSYRVLQDSSSRNISRSSRSSNSSSTPDARLRIKHLWGQTAL